MSKQEEVRNTICQAWWAVENANKKQELSINAKTVEQIKVLLEQAQSMLK
jgi:hypothetical protein